MKYLPLAVVFAAASVPALAQVSVVDSQPVMPKAPVAAASSDSSSQGQAEMFYQLQVLQQEVLELRGQVEGQAYELKRLKQQRLDDYVDLDKRIAALSGQPVANGSETRSSVDSASVGGESSAAASATNGLDERELYRQAINLVLKQKDYDQAAKQFVSYLDNFPQGLYAPNAMYWLGEIYLLRSQLNDSEIWFNRLLTEFSSHSKIPDAKFKLGTVYHQLGQDAKAKKLLQEVAGSDTTAAQLAKDYLAKAFTP